MATTVERMTLLEEPEWSPKYMQPELDKLHEELAELSEIVKATERKMRECEKRISAVQGLTKGLLSATGDDLIHACGKVLTALGWDMKRAADDDKQELVLSLDGDPQALARIVWADPQVVHLDLGKLVISQVAQWCRHRSEPKGILILSPQAGGKPMEPDQDVFSAECREYAEKKNVCLMTTVQLLCFYKELELGKTSPEQLREALFNSTGTLEGYMLEPAKVVAAA